MQPERDTKLPRATLKVEFRHSLEPPPPTQGLTTRGDVEDIEMLEETALGDCNPQVTWEHSPKQSYHWFVTGLCGRKPDSLLYIHG